MQTARIILPLTSLSKPPFNYSLTKQKNPDSFHHLHRVLRVKPGWKVELLDENSSLILAGTISDLTPESVEISVDSSEEKARSTNLTLILGLPEFSVLENVVEKLTEIGSAEIKIFIPDHTQHKQALSRLESKVERLKKIRNAARIQSGSGPLKISTYDSLKQLLESDSQRLSSPFKNRFIASLQDHSTNFQEFLHKNYPLEPRTYLSDTFLIVGPEGDLSFEEYKLADSYGFQPLSLGSSVLRVETAAICGSFCLINYFS